MRHHTRADKGLIFSLAGNGNWRVLLVYQDSYTSVMDSTVKVIVSHHKIKCSGESGSSISWIFPLGHIHFSTRFIGTEPLNYWKAITVKDKNKFLQALHWPINESLFIELILATRWHCQTGVMWTAALGWRQLCNISHKAILTNWLDVLYITSHLIRNNWLDPLFDSDPALIPLWHWFCKV